MNNVSAVFETLRELLPDIEYRLDEPLKEHTSFRIGGPVSVMFFPKSPEELRILCGVLKNFSLKALVIGNGTNLLADDGPIDLAVVKTHAGLGDIRLTGETEITAESGVLLSRLAGFALEHALTGLEFAHGIPGTLGGAVAMNAGAYGGEMKDVVAKTSFLGQGLALYDIYGADHAFSYRRSRFSDSGDIILSSVLRLKKGDPQEIRARMEALAAKRRESQPLTLPSAGSTFKRPKNGYAAALIDQAGLRGYAVGGAMVSDKHTGFVVNRGGATFEDVLAVMDHVREEVLRRFGTALEPEVKIIRSAGR
ncbi:UDP-N-acetylmuramate dehydrogenase [Sporobacter termitidis DSM 10068]|uniref:UDP-N-acetylenolpyruvoylglucosamine reductase n=1 Tax=Sporobacter termitidis DSM 10068 TaxID=1123282 RepID=A0A1M5X2D5_9FIRM|nr:UDP-N-acetylmuramate dehydrogenase [Sporobacter termitidis]SHH93674.1 UDP-N-acetylmuramate dehydrogenase [Sporobacter termitidis DSM 10068]